MIFLNAWDLHFFDFIKKKMEPPPAYTEHSNLCVIDWDAVAPYITPQRITPQMYEALLVVARQLIREFAEAKTVAEVRKREFDHSPYTGDLRLSRVLWKVVHIFSESRSSWIFSCWLTDYLWHADLNMFLVYESYPYFRGHELDFSVAFDLVLPLLQDLGLLLNWKGTRLRIRTRTVSWRHTLLNEQFIILQLSPLVEIVSSQQAWYSVIWRV